MRSQRPIDQLEPTIREAGRVLLRYWPGMARRNPGTEVLDVQRKQDGSAVTQADVKSEHLLVAAVTRLFPQDGIFSEEKTVQRAPASSQDYYWVIDPLDGTQSFVNGNNDFSVLVGRVQQGKVESGAMFFPARSLFARAVRGEGATLNGVPLRVSSNRSLSSRRVYLRHCNVGADHPQYAEVGYDRWMDSGMAFLSVANGDFDGLILKMIHHQEWDYAAAQLMIEEAGGKVTDEHGNPIAIQCCAPQFTYLVASNGIIHKELLHLLATRIVF